MITVSIDVCMVRKTVLLKEMILLLGVILLIESRKGRI